jgi:hypothetical protein
MAVTVTRGTNLVEHYQSTPLTAVNDSFEIHADSSEFTFAAVVTGGANFSLVFEASYNGGGTYFELDTSKTINSNGQFAYFYTGKPAHRVRMRIASISSGTPSVIPIIAVAYHG